MIYKKSHIKWHLFLVATLCWVTASFFISCTNNSVGLGERTSFDITSSHTDATYNIQVRLPADHDSSKTFETIYTLDGKWYFDHTSEESARISEQQNRENAIIVGIKEGNPRTTDYMPTTTSEGEGGAEDFTFFLEEELIPHMEEHFQSDTTRHSRAILGHSAGGLYAAYAFTRHNYLFGNYLMLSPAIWYDDGIILQYESENKENLESTRQSIFISKAELEATQLFTDMFYDRLESYENTDLAFFTVKGKDHASSANNAIAEALSFYFN